MSERSALSGIDGAAEFSRLISDVSRLTDLLDQHGEEHWFRWARGSLAELQRHDAHGLQRLRQAYGGMGSFNDLVLDAASVDDRRRVNAELDALRTRVYGDVSALLHRGRHA